MFAAVWTGEDIALLSFCGLLIVLALGFFIFVFVADFRESRRKSQARRALRRRTKPLH